MTTTCGIDPGDEYAHRTYWYMYFAICIPTIALMQFLWFFRTMYHALYNKEWKKTHIRARFFYIALQICALIWTTNELMKMVIHPPTGLLSSDIGCSIAAWINRIFPHIYYCLYLYQILLRLQISLRGSYLGLSCFTFYLLLFLIIAPMACTVSLLWITNAESPCHRIWKPSDFPSVDNDAFGYCVVPINAGKPFLMIVTVIIVSLNILFGVIFILKLKRLLADNEYNVNIKSNFKKLMAKISILTLTGSASTVLSYGLLLMLGSAIGAVFVYLDIFINITVIGLMFPHNKKHYKRIFKLCRLKKLRKKKRMHPLNDEKHEVDLSRVPSRSGWGSTSGIESSALSIGIESIAAAADASVLHPVPGPYKMTMTSVRHKASLPAISQDEEEEDEYTSDSSDTSSSSDDDHHHDDDEEEEEEEVP